MKGNITKTRDRRSARRRNATILVIILLLLFTVTLSIVLLCGNGDNSYRPDLPEIRLNGDDGFSPNQTQKGIMLRGATGLVFEEGSLEQTVDIPNVQENEYAFVLSIYLADGTQLFKSYYVYRGDVLKKIKLNQTLRSGIYKNALMVYSCYTVDASHIAVSQCEFPIEIKCN